MTSLDLAKYLVMAISSWTWSSYCLIGMALSKNLVTVTSLAAWSRNLVTVVSRNLVTVMSLAAANWVITFCMFAFATLSRKFRLNYYYLYVSFYISD